MAALLPDRVERHTFPSGYPTTAGTVGLLARSVLRDSKKPRLRARVRELFRGLPSLDVDAEIRAVWEFVLGHVRYMKDVLGTEHITYPEELDKEVDDGTAAEDCESIAAYAAALLAAAGIESRFVIVGKNPARPTDFRHCYLEVENYRTGRWIAFDTVGALEQGLALGQAVAWSGPIERWTLEGRKESPMSLDLRGCLCRGGDDRTLRGAMLGDALDDFKKGWSDLHELLRPIAEGIAEELPIAKPFVKAGDAIYDFAEGKPVTPEQKQALAKVIEFAKGGKKVNILPPPPKGGKGVALPKKPSQPIDGGKVAAGAGIALLAAKLFGAF